MSEEKKPQGNIFASIGFFVGLAGALVLKQILIPTAGSVMMGAVYGGIFGAIGGGGGALVGTLIGNLFKNSD